MEAFLREVWDINSVKGWDANDMLGLIHTWQHGDLSQFRHNGDYERALAGIEAKGLIMPSKTDLYFPVSVVIREEVDDVEFWLVA